MNSHRTGRPLCQTERVFLRALLVAIPNGQYFIEQLGTASVTSMDDGGQGGLRFHQSGPDRRFERQLVEYRFRDLDSVSVSATVNIDQYGDLFELDLFKGDFSPLLAYPDTFELPPPLT